jgi:hypothetical protein
MQNGNGPTSDITDKGRRALLEWSAASGLAAAAGALGFLGAADRAEAAQATSSFAPPTKKMRRIVSAHNPEGKSYIASDEAVDVSALWNGTPDQTIGKAGDNEPPGITKATGQQRCFVAAIPPSKDPKPSMENRIGYHRGNGISYCLILDGELTYMVDMQETKVRAGDLIVERNTLHSWRNEGTQPVSMFIVTINAA